MIRSVLCEQFHAPVGPPLTYDRVEVDVVERTINACDPDLGPEGSQSLRQQFEVAHVGADQNDSFSLPVGAFEEFDVFRIKHLPDEG